MHKKESEQYLRSYPDLLKWINECPICHSKEYKTEMPEHIGGENSIAARHIRNTSDL